MYKFPDCLFKPVITSKKDWHFDFVIENITEKQAHHLLDWLVDYAEGYSTNLGGGCSPVQAEEKTEIGVDLATSLVESLQTIPPEVQRVLCAAKIVTDKVVHYFRVPFSPAVQELIYSISMMEEKYGQK